MIDEFTLGDFRAVVRHGERIEKGPTKVFTVEWYKGGELLVWQEGFEDYKAARREAQDVLNNYYGELDFH